MPSLCIHAEWILAFNEKVNDAIPQFHECIETPQDMGRWLIPTNREVVERRWGLVSEQTRLGKLGVFAYVSSKKHADEYNRSKNGSHVIAIYTPNMRDYAYIHKVREKLKSIGITWKIRYTKRPLKRDDNSSGVKTIYYE